MNDYLKQMKKHTRKQQLRDARRKTGLRSKNNKPRIKKVTHNDWDDLDDMEFDTVQPILSRGESERRRKIEKSISDTTNDNSQDSALSQNSMEDVTQKGHPALVVETSSGM